MNIKPFAPFIAGTMLLVIGLHFHNSDVGIAGAIAAAYGFIYMVKALNKQEPSQ